MTAASWEILENSIQIKVREEFGLLLRKLDINGSGIEIGVAQGEFSEVLLQTSALKKLFLLDSWKEYKGYEDSNNVSQEEQDRRYFSVLDRMDKYGNRATVIRSDCNDAVKYMGDAPFGFIYIDANHEYESVKKDLEQWYPKLKTGGLFAGHDYMNGKMGDGTVFGVKQAVDEFVERLGNVELFVTTDDTPFVGNTDVLMDNDKRYFSWYFRKV